MGTLKTSTIVVVGLVSLALFMGCSRSSEQKLADAKANVVAATQDVKEKAADAQANAREAWLTFKSEAEAQIAANDKIIADYKARMTTADGKLRAKYDKKIDALKEKNEALKEQLEAYQDNGRDKSEEFKSKFSHDMHELGTALKNFVDDDTK